MCSCLRLDLYVVLVYIITKKKKNIVSEIYPTFLEGVRTILLQTVWSSIICLRKNEFKISLLVLSICFLSLVNVFYSFFFLEYLVKFFYILIKCFYLENVNFHSSCSEGCSKWFNISSSSRVNRNQT